MRKRSLKVQDNADPRVKRLMDELLAKNMTLDDLYAAAGVEDSTVRGWRNGSSPRLSLIEACFNAVGMTLQPVYITRTNQN